MAGREIQYGQRFKRDLEKLERKYRGIHFSVNVFLDNCSRNGPSSTSNRIPNLNLEPVYKDRIALPGIGKRKGVRIVYYCDRSRVVALYLYTKNDRENISPKEITDALGFLGE